MKDRLYNDSFHLMPISPYRCFAYWDVSRTIDSIIRRQGFLRILINNQIYSDNMIDQGKGDYYIDIEPESNITALIGYHDNITSEFNELLRSNTIQSPKENNIEGLISSQEFLKKLN